VKQIGRKSMEGIQLALYEQRDPVKTVMNLQIKKKAGNFLSS
jgi:hypothetical protein